MPAREVVRLERTEGASSTLTVTSICVAGRQEESSAASRAVQRRLRGERKGLKVLASELRV